MVSAPAQARQGRHLMSPCVRRYGRSLAVAAPDGSVDQMAEAFAHTRSVVVAMEQGTGKYYGYVHRRVSCDDGPDLNVNLSE